MIKYEYVRARAMGMFLAYRIPKPKYIIVSHLFKSIRSLLYACGMNNFDSYTDRVLVTETLFM